MNERDANSRRKRVEDLLAGKIFDVIKTSPQGKTTSRRNCSLHATPGNTAVQVCGGTRVKINTTRGAYVVKPADLLYQNRDGALVVTKKGGGCIEFTISIYP